jgi:hypothetical protein
MGENFAAAGLWRMAKPQPEIVEMSHAVKLHNFLLKVKRLPKRISASNPTAPPRLQRHQLMHGNKEPGDAVHSL